MNRILKYLEFISKLSLIVLIFMTHFAVKAEDKQKGAIKNIVIVGNELTGENVIIRELLIKVGDLADEQKLELSRKRP